MNELNNNRDKFNILSLNCESINAKIDQIRLKLAQYKEGGADLTQSVYKKLGCRKIPINLFSVLKNMH